MAGRHCSTGTLDLGRTRVAHLRSLRTNALHLCCHRGKQMLQQCLHLRVRWLDVFQRDQSLALFAPHFDLYPMKCCGECMHFCEPQLGVHPDRGNRTCYSGPHFIYGIRIGRCCLPQACLDLSDEIGSHRWQYRCS